MISTRQASIDPFVFPPWYNFPPFFTPQPNSTTRLAQLQKWSSLILSYCRHHGIWRLSLIDAIETPLFNNETLNKSLPRDDVQFVVGWMTTQEGGQRAEWAVRDGTKSSAWIYWRRPEEWADLIADWVQETGLKNTVLTLYELSQGDMVASQEFRGMDSDVLHKSLDVLVKRGRAQVFGTDDQQGVKFF